MGVYVEVDCFKGDKGWEQQSGGGGSRWWWDDMTATTRSSINLVLWY